MQQIECQVRVPGNLFQLYEFSLIWNEVMQLQIARVLMLFHKQDFTIM